MVFRRRNIVTALLPRGGTSLCSCRRRSRKRQGGGIDAALVFSVTVDMKWHRE
jgi:hypothetical protein